MTDFVSQRNMPFATAGQPSQQMPKTKALNYIWSFDVVVNDIWSFDLTIIDNYQNVARMLYLWSGNRTNASVSERSSDRRIDLVGGSP
jgi:hypothetical protein